MFQQFLFHGKIIMSNHDEVRSFPIFYGEFQLHNISNVLTSSHDHYLWTNTSQKTLEKHVQNVSLTIVFET